MYLTPFCSLLLIRLTHCDIPSEGPERFGEDLVRSPRLPSGLSEVQVRELTCPLLRKIDTAGNEPCLCGFGGYRRAAFDIQLVSEAGFDLRVTSSFLL